VRCAFPNLDGRTRIVTKTGVVANEIERTGTGTAATKQLGAAAGDHDRLLAKGMIMEIERIASTAAAATAQHVDCRRTRTATAAALNARCRANELLTVRID
jgi:hypothetical protein